MKAKSTRAFNFEGRPAVKVVVRTHDQNCPFRKAAEAGGNSFSRLRVLLTEKCECPKHMYVKQVRYREALGETTGSWPSARRRSGPTRVVRQLIESSGDRSTLSQQRDSS